MAIVCVPVRLPPPADPSTTTLRAFFDFVNQVYQIDGSNVVVGDNIDFNGGSVTASGLVIPENAIGSEIIGALFNLLATTFEWVLVIEWDKDTGSTPENGQTLFVMSDSLGENFVSLDFDTLGPGSQTLIWQDADNAAFQEGDRSVTLFFPAPGIADGIHKAAIRRVDTAIAISYDGQVTENNSGSSGSGPKVVAFSTPPNQAYFGGWADTTHEPTIIRTFEVWGAGITEAGLPSLSEPADGGIQVSPASASLVLSTTAPTVSSSIQITPAAGNLVLSSTAPTVSAPILLSPPSANLTLSTTTPTVSQAAFNGVLARKSADQTTANFTSTTSITWDAEDYDTDAAHDTGSNTNRITVPAAFNGRYGVFHANVYLTSVANGVSCLLWIAKAGSADYVGVGIVNTNAPNGVGVLLEATTQPMLLATGDIYTTEIFLTGDTSVTLEAESSAFSLEIVG